MKKPAIVYYEVLGFQPETRVYMDAHFEVYTLVDPDHDRSDALEAAEVLFAPMGYAFGADKMDACSRLKVIGTPTTGTLHIDVEHARRKGVHICSLKEARPLLSTITPTAELTWGLILAVTRKILPAHASVLNGMWTGREFGKQTPRMLSRMSLGVVGLGRLGAWVARYGNAFGMDVYYYDPYVSDDRYAKCRTLGELAEVSDIVTVHVHLSDTTRHLIDGRFMSAMPDGGYVINTARGGIVHEAALLDALESGKMAGAALDMLEGEHLPGFTQKLNTHPLIRYAKTRDNLILTPKMGGCTQDAWQATERYVIDDILKELRKRGVM